MSKAKRAVVGIVGVVVIIPAIILIAFNIYSLHVWLFRWLLPDLFHNSFSTPLPLITTTMTFFVSAIWVAVVFDSGIEF